MAGQNSSTSILIEDLLFVSTPTGATSAAVIFDELTSRDDLELTIHLPSHLLSSRFEQILPPLPSIGVQAVYSLFKPPKIEYQICS